MIGGDGINDESNKTAPAPTRNTDLTKNRERLARPKSTLRHSKISIHAPRRGSDDLADLILDTISRISIHAPRMGSDSAFLERPELHFQFQSTLPGWGATKPIQGDRQNRKDFNPRSPDGERHGDVANVTVTDVFQSTLPGWGATGRIGTWVWTIIFQSTLPGWGATVAGNIIGRGQIFQSTLPGWGATAFPWMPIAFLHDFNPRSPDGERLRHIPFDLPVKAISIHAPRMGSDLFLVSGFHSREAFQSTLPGWGATTRSGSESPLPEYFNPRSPDGERPMIYFSFSSVALFQSTLPGWGATSPLAACRRHRRHFNPRSPDGERRRSCPG